MQSHRARYIGLFLYPFSAGASAPLCLAVLQESRTVTSRAVKILKAVVKQHVNTIWKLGQKGTIDLVTPYSGHSY